MVVARKPNSKASGSAPTKEKKRKMLGSSVEEEEGTKSDKTAIESGSQPKKNNNNQGVRVVHGQVYDSENGAHCHQCRRRTYGAFVTCKNKAKAKPCKINYCDTCLLNRYGEKVEEVTSMEEWSCPRCRGACSCSICRKKREKTDSNANPSVPVTSSVDEKPKKSNQKKPKPEESKEMISENGNNNAIKPKKIIQKKLKLQVSNEMAVENGNNGAVSKVNGGQKKQNGTKKTIQDENKVEDKNTGDENKDQNALELSNNSLDTITPLPTGTELLTIVGVDLPKEDIGNALQFLEFCATFGKILDMKKGQAEAVLKDLLKVGSTRRGKSSVAIKFHIQLLSVIQSELKSESESESERGSDWESSESEPESESDWESEAMPTQRKDSWLKGLKSCIPKSYLSEKINRIDGKAGGYDRLNSSTRLRLLTFLCDEVLGTEKIRNCFDDQNVEFEYIKTARSKLSDAREKEKSLKQRMKDDIDIDDKERPDAVRIEPVFKDSDFHFYWRLKGCTDKPGILLQDIGIEDLDLSVDRWFEYDDEQMDLIEKHISLLRSLNGSEKAIKTV